MKAKENERVVRALRLPLLKRKENNIVAFFFGSRPNPPCGWKMRLIGVQLVEPFPRQAKLITGFVESRDQFHTTTNQRGHEQTGGGKREAPVGYLQLDSRT